MNKYSTFATQGSYLYVKSIYVIYHGLPSCLSVIYLSVYGGWHLLSTLLKWQVWVKVPMFGQCQWILNILEEYDLKKFRSHQYCLRIIRQNLDIMGCVCVKCIAFFLNMKYMCGLVILSQTSRKTPFTHRQLSRILKLFLNAVLSGISSVKLKKYWQSGLCQYLCLLRQLIQRTILLLI